MAEYASLRKIEFELCGGNLPEKYKAFVRRVLNDRNLIPAADVAPVVHGRWVSFLDGDHIMPERYYRCSRCGRVESRRQPYCHCGAKMDGKEVVRIC